MLINNSKSIDKDDDVMTQVNVTRDVRNAIIQYRFDIDTDVEIEHVGTHTELLDILESHKTAISTEKYTVE
jgi:hypothetical protein